MNELTVIRPATENDVPGILYIVNQEILFSTVLYEYEPRTLEMQMEWFREKAANGWPLLIAELNGKVVGFGTYGPFRTRPAYSRSIEHSVYVHKDFRGQTVGHRLMVELIRLARTSGFHTMIAGIDSSNKGSVEFHRKFGFETVGSFREVGHKFDRWLDVIFMQLMLE
ncbi:MAG: N-acetyltransferase [Flavobacteriales bacterium]|nr:N-acetyltransferase [Flavobacteriales bacterium]